MRSQLEFATTVVENRAGRRSWGTIVLSRERTERLRTIPSFRKKNKRIECILKNIGTICKGTEWKGTEIAWKERLKSGTRSYYQERVLSRERILNQERAGAYEEGGMDARPPTLEMQGRGLLNIASRDLLKKTLDSQFWGQYF